MYFKPAKVPTEFYRGQLPLQLAVDGSIEDSEEDNQSKDQELMNVERDVLGDDRPQQSSEGAAHANNDSSPTKDKLAKVDDTFDDETQGPEELASYNVQTQSLPMTLSTGDLAKSSEKPAEAAPASEPNNATPASETPKKKKKSGSKKKKAEKPASSDVEPAETSSQKSNRSTRSKKKMAKNSSSASTNENADTEKTKEKSKSKKKSDKTKESTKDKTKDKGKDKTKDKTKEKDTKEKKKKDKTPKEKKKKKTSAATDSSSGTVSSTNTSLVAPEPTASQEAPPKAAEQVEQPAAQPTAELPVPTTTDAPNNAPILIQETVVLHDQPAEVDKDPNKIYDEQNHSIPNLNDDDMDAMMMSFHQELESASQLDLNAVPDYIVDVSPEKSSYPLIRDLGSPLITSHTSSQAPASQQAGFHFGHSNQEFSLGMPSDASSQARNVAPSQASADVAINNNNTNNASEGSEDNAGKSSSSISQELISGTMRNLPSPEKDQSETPAKEKHSLLEEMLMSDPAEANNITDSQADKYVILRRILKKELTFLAVTTKKSILHSTQICLVTQSLNGKAQESQRHKESSLLCHKAKVICTLSSFLRATIQAKTSKARTRDRTRMHWLQSRQRQTITMRMSLRHHRLQAEKTASRQKREDTWSLTSTKMHLAHRLSHSQLLRVKSLRQTDLSSRYQRHPPSRKSALIYLHNRKHSYHVSLLLRRQSLSALLPNLHRRKMLLHHPLWIIIARLRQCITRKPRPRRD